MAYQHTWRVTTYSEAFREAHEGRLKKAWLSHSDRRLAEENGRLPCIVCDACGFAKIAKYPPPRDLYSICGIPWHCGDHLARRVMEE